MNAEIIAIGSELLTPRRVDTNSLWLTEQLNNIGIQVSLKTIVGDDEHRLEDVLREAVRRSDLVISTGGLGPTEDDITRKVFSRVLGRRLILEDRVLEGIRARFAKIGVPMAANNERQALVLDEAEILENRRGTAPGQLVQHGSATVVLQPGPPRELKPMFVEQVLPQLEKRAVGVRIRTRVLRTTGLGESAVDQKIAPIYSRYSNPTTTILCSPGDVEIHLTATAVDGAAAERQLDELAEKLEDALGNHVYSFAGEALEQIVGRALTIKQYTLAVAESCTGGLLAQRLTDVPGSSAYFLEGLVTYSNAAKERLLGITPELLHPHGAVSEEVAAAMAVGVRERSGANIGVSITGIAGPDGGTDEKPVGTVFVGLAGDAHREVKKLQLFGDRSEIRWRATQSALDLVRRRFLL
jgi:nicotinamide-nucleotide amidase